MNISAIYPWQKNDWARLQELRRRPLSGLLFKGAKGIGKLELAIKFGQSLLCQHPDESGFACGKCPSCHWFEQDSHPDFRLLQPEVLNLEGEETDDLKPASGKKPSKQISVDQVRGLADFISMSAHQGGRRVVVIHPAEAMNANAANALLKNLEEPPQGLLFILVSHKPQQLLPTILSRCLSFALAAPDSVSATQWLAQQGVKNPAEALALSGFAPLHAIHLDEQLG
ncbi:MAG: DNA polymerase III subunit delta', partial [Gallionella sp.]|nr:DNA polymerase III subunit delta' [Gallionella sp.]